MKKNMVFICGCARSGTSALWRLMTAHSKVAIGLERYIERCTDTKFDMTPELFEKERFYTLKRGDTHFKSIEKGGQGEYYAQLKDRYNDCTHFGDKTPRLFRYYKDIFKTFPDARILFIYRNIFDVAQSFNTRKQKEGDAWDRGYKAAVKDWNLSMKNTNAFLDQKDERILPISYEELFFGQFDIEQIFDFLNLENEPSVHKLYQGLRKKAKEIEGKREPNLSSLQKHFIMKTARFNLYKKLVEHKELHSKLEKIS